MNALEKASLKELFLSSPALQEEARALEEENPHQGKRCNFLRANGECLVYEARPIVCRTHGAPVQAKGLDVEGETWVDVCPLNFQGIEISSLPPAHVLNLDTINMILAVLTNHGFRGDESRTLLSVGAILHE